MRSVLIAIFSLWSAALYSQPADTGGRTGVQDHKNNLYVGAGIGSLWISRHIDYERQLSSFGKKPGMLYLRGAFGLWEVWGGGGEGGLVSLNTIKGKKAHHIEAGFGLSVLYNSKLHSAHLEFPQGNYEERNYFLFLPAINAGYRYQTNTGLFFFRAGLSFPEGLYAGAGLHF